MDIVIPSRESFLPKGLSSSLTHPIAVTIGNFDGLHLGHQKIFHTMEQLVKEKNGTLVLITFASHPLEFLKPGTKVPKITPYEEKLKRLKELHLDVCIILEFTAEIQKNSYETFLHKIREQLPFDYLVLGEGAAFGKEKKGTQQEIEKFAKKEGFKALYLPKITYNGHVVSSQLIREKLKIGDVETTQKLLGRPYALYAPTNLQCLQERGEHRLKITFDFINHCQIPSGEYVVLLRSGGHQTTAIAHLTSLGSDQLAKTFDLEIFIKGPVSPFMNDQIMIEFLRKIASSQ